MKKRKSNLWQTNKKFTMHSVVNALGLASTASLALLTLAFATPELAMNNNTHALVIDCDGRECDAVTTIKTDVNVGTVISLGLDSYIGVDIVPKTEGAFASESTRLTVATNSPEGYSLYMQTIDGTSKLSNITNPEFAATINPLGEAVTNDAIFSNPKAYANQWGYALSSTNAIDDKIVYQAVPINQASPIKVTSGMSGDGASEGSTGDVANLDSYDLAFGVSIDTNLPAGTYSNRVLVSAVANPVSITNLNQLVYMQDMTPEICANTAFDVEGHMTKETADLHNPVTKRLVDTRDGKKYWVAKLADGECWMTQNLALDITAEMANATGNSGLLNSTTTDIGYNNNGELIDGVKYWNKDSEYPPEETDSKPANQIDNDTTTYSWGLYQDALNGIPVNYTNCQRPDDSDQHKLNSLVYGTSIDTHCGYRGFFNMNDSEWTPNYVSQKGNYTALNPNTGDDLTYTDVLLAFDFEKKAYDAHYLFGNYYQYNTAVAGSGGNTLLNKNAVDSICPKGWQLPKSGNVDTIPGTLNTDPGTWYYLLEQYGVERNISSVSPIDGETYDIAAPPLYANRNGHIIGGGNIRGIGGYGFLTASTAGSNSMQRYIYQFTTLSSPNDNSNNRRRAISVRCLAR